MDLALDTSTLSSTISEKVSNLQESFLNSTIGNALNNALDTGLRFVLPDIIEDEVIEIKDAFLENGVSEGVSKIAETVKDFAKSALGIVTGNFENVSQIKMATESGGIIDTISNLLDTVIDKVEEKGIINESVATMIKTAKNSILKTTSNNISSSLDEQVEYLEKLDKYNEAWIEAFENEDLEAMETAYENIEKYLNKTLTTENSFVVSRVIENLQSLIENNNGNFDLSEEELELAEKLY